MKKAISFILAMVMMVSTSAMSYAADNKIKVDENETGLIISAEDFNQIFCGEPSTRKTITNRSTSKGESSIKINTISLDGYTLEVDATVFANGVKSQLYAKGELFDSYKREDGKNAFVGVFEDVNADYKIRLFEVYNDIDPTSKLLKSSSKESKHLKIYLVDEKDNLLMFEIALPKVFEGLNKSRGKYTDSINDAFWYVGIVKPIQNTEIEATQENIDKIGLDLGIEQRGNGYFSQCNFDGIKTSSFYVGSDYTVCYSLPYVKYKHLDVRPQSTWILNFKIAEHTTVNGTTYRSISNVFRYRKLDLKMAAGGRTTFIRTTRQGKMVDPLLGLRKAGDSIKSYIMKKLISSIPYAPTINTVAGWISTAGSSQTITLGSNAISLSGDYVTAVGTKIKSCELYKCTDYDGNTDIGHYYYYQVDAQYEGTGAASNTNGLMRVSFDIFNYADYSTTSSGDDFELSYTADNN